MRPKRDIISIRRNLKYKQNNEFEDEFNETQICTKSLSFGGIQSNLETDKELLKLIVNLTKFDISIRNRKFEILRLKGEAKKLAESLKKGVKIVIFLLFFYGNRFNII